ncbi:MAG: hypothetical protein EXQ77_05475 [Thermoleophilia bacterium]|nr:hypothetical protein [Thermoleophilia bacterium]
MHDEILTRLIDTALTNPAFQGEARHDLTAALAARGFALEPDESVDQVRAADRALGSWWALEATSLRDRPQLAEIVLDSLKRGTPGKVTSTKRALNDRLLAKVNAATTRQNALIASITPKFQQCP